MSSITDVPPLKQRPAWGELIAHHEQLAPQHLRDLFDADLRWINHYGFKPLDIPTLAGGLSG